MRPSTSVEKITFIPWRFYLVILLILIISLGLVWRVFTLAILNQHFLRHQGDERVLRQVLTPAFRGMIVDRNHYPLAVSTIAYSVWLNPKEFVPTQASLTALSTLLGIRRNTITENVKRYRDRHREFVYLARGLAPQIQQKIKALHLPGIYTQEEYKRFYPEGEVLAHIIGFTNIDDQGQEGLELAYDDWLKGNPGKKWVIKDRLSRVISDVQTVREQKPGKDLILSIDRRIQYLAYRTLLEGIEGNQALSGSAIVLDVKTGEVLAMVNHPSFNPNNHQARVSEHIRNRAVTDTFEPGSTIKAFTVASALESGRYQPDAVIDTYPGWMRVDHNLVKDEKNNGPLTLAQILQLSSNMGAAKLALTMPPDQLWSLLHRMGFGRITGVGFPGEQEGSLVRHTPWGAFVLASLSYGYGLSVTTLQLARAYAILANDGVKMPLSLLKVDKVEKGEPVLSPKITHHMLNLLESVVTKGMGRKASVPGYRVGGKTGTSFKAGAGGYQQHRYTSSFVGIAPLSHPRLVVAVVIHDPQGKNHLGGKVSAPLFARIMEGSLRIMAIPPDSA